MILEGEAELLDGGNIVKLVRDALGYLVYICSYQNLQLHRIT
jgi:hypothetical protein